MVEEYNLCDMGYYTKEEQEQRILTQIIHEIPYILHQKSSRTINHRS